MIQHNCRHKLALVPLIYVPVVHSIAVPTSFQSNQLLLLRSQMHFILGETLNLNSQVLPQSIQFLSFNSQMYTLFSKRFIVMQTSFQASIMSQINLRSWPLDWHKVSL
uniref:Uncharacterized protein n=1 Tax=Opuntia streptacantha TaxID=393608 RepID=A0A7C9CK76_OPUST